MKESLTPDDSAEREVCRWATDNGYTRIYGNWLTTSPIAARSDGSVVAGSWYESVFKILGYINPQDIYSEADNEKAVYCLEPWNREAALEYAASQGVVLVPAASFDGGRYELYLSPRQLMYK